MTRVNIHMKPILLSDSHLLAEHREIIRLFKLGKDYWARDPKKRSVIPNDFKLGKGHVNFFYDKLDWVADRYLALYAECTERGFNVTDMSDAAGTAWLDVKDRKWSDTLLANGGMRVDQMPELLEGTAVVGPLQAARADLGLPKTALVVAGGADNAVSACGVGALGEGDGFVSLGTSGVVLAGRDRYAPRAESAVHTFCHAVPDRWYQMGVVLAATDSLNWLSRVTGQSPSVLSDAVGNSLMPPGAVRFYPYLSGERTPYNDAQIRGGFTGLEVATGPEDLTRAVMVGVSFALRDSLEALRSTGTQLDSALAIGGGCRSDHWTTLLATILNIPLERPDESAFGAAIGAARIAICGVTGAAPENVMIKPPIKDIIAPDPDHVAAYDDAYRGFAAAYPSLKAMP
ncbi:MAG: xylulokinase [Tateyamaria sp.]|nr:xylulokinase [Tateyamaria sp.]